MMKLQTKQHYMQVHDETTNKTTLHVGSSWNYKQNNTTCRFMMKLQNNTTCRFMMKLQTKQHYMQVHDETTNKTTLHVGS